MSVNFEDLEGKTLSKRNFLGLAGMVKLQACYLCERTHLYVEERGKKTEKVLCLVLLGMAKEG